MEIDIVLDSAASLPSIYSAETADYVQQYACLRLFIAALFIISKNEIIIIIITILVKVKLATVTIT